MGKGLAFLNLKFFHPGNRDNQQRKWEALQREAQQQKREREREDEFRRERELKEYRLKIMRSTKGEESEDYRREIARSAVAFLYDEPPGLKRALEAERKKVSEESRRKEWQSAMQCMSRSERRLAERQMEEGLSVHEKNARRFEYLKNAPLAADYVKDLEVTHKPFGQMVKHVKCFRCGNWGHRVGDRLCPASTHFTKGFYDDDPAAVRAVADDRQKQKQKEKTKEKADFHSLKSEASTTAAIVKREHSSDGAETIATANADFVWAETEELQFDEHLHCEKKAVLDSAKSGKSHKSRKRRLDEIGEDVEEMIGSAKDSAKVGGDDDLGLSTEDPLSDKYFSKRRRVDASKLSVASANTGAIDGSVQKTENGSISDRYVVERHCGDEKREMGQSADGCPKTGGLDALLSRTGATADDLAFVQSLSLEEKRQLLAELSGDKKRKRKKERKARKRERHSDEDKEYRDGRGERRQCSRRRERRRSRSRDGRRRHERYERRYQSSTTRRRTSRRH